MENVVFTAGAWYNVNKVLNAAETIIKLWCAEHDEAYKQFCKNNENKTVKIKKFFFLYDTIKEKRTEDELLNLWHSYDEDGDGYLSWRTNFMMFNDAFKEKYGVYGITVTIKSILNMCKTEMNNGEIFLSNETVNCFGKFLNK